MSSAQNNPGNFANRDKDELREIAAKGGRASHGGSNPEAHEAKQAESGSTQSQSSSGTGHQGGSKETNPGNFANWDKDDLRAVASKGGKASGASRSNDDEE